MLRKKNNILIVGAGPVGLVSANILSKLKQVNSICILDKRNHIGGNCFDYINKSGLLVHKYGPHYFRTNSKKILNYLSKFTEWIKGDYIVKSSVNKHLYDFPINLNTLEKFFKKKLNEKTAKKILNNEKETVDQDNFENFLISKIGRKLYENFYKNYTIKQWGIDPKKIPSSVAKRIPIRFNRKKEYVDAEYKLMPKNGYTEMFKKMITSDKIKMILKENFSKKKHKANIVIYTGPIDLYFNYKYGKLNWRSLNFKFQTFKKKKFQNFLQINFPNDYKFTRIVEYKHVTKQKSQKTTISKEYSKKHGDPYYPINTEIDKKIYNKYYKEAKKLEKQNIFFCGRLAEYTYINTDEAIHKGMELAKKIRKKIENGS